MFDFKDATQWDKDIMLAWFMYRMSIDERFALMADLPESYNRINGREIVKSMRVTPLNGNTNIITRESADMTIRIEQGAPNLDL